MPRKGYHQKFTHEEVIDLFRNGEYTVDTERGIVSAKNGKPLFTFCNSNRSSCPWVRLYRAPKMISIPVSHCVWLTCAQVPIPRGFEIHHRDRDQTHNWWNNLFCLFRLDHSKLHNGHSDLLEEESEF